MKLSCWGLNSSGQTDIPGNSSPAYRVQADSAHDSHANPQTPNSMDDDQSLHVNQVSAGHLHTCSVRRFGELVCWGWNQHQQVTIPFAVFTVEGE
mmetsp:Transcript_40041/g.33827  ORF Transcript_40041/g.33827 Transcript_40041/m.33827 type:complete len:95 (-) Transcript_40041:240-524(-)